MQDPLGGDGGLLPGPTSPPLAQKGETPEIKATCLCDLGL